MRKWLQSLLRPWKRSARLSHQEVLRGLGAPVELRISSSGVNHIFSKREEDLFRAQGFVTARDRLFQMDTARRAASGRLAEWYGDVPAMGFDPVLHLRGNGLASVDYMMRVLGLQEAADDGLSWISPRSFRALLAYSEGVNEWIALARKRDELPAGYDLLNAQPEEWSPTDSLLILRLLAFRLGFSWRLLLAFGAICFQLHDTPKRLHSMLPPHLDLDLSQLDSLKPFVQSQHRRSIAQDASSEGRAAQGSWPSGTGQGSCAWVVSGAMTRAGGPLLCNDPHLALGLPSAFYQVRLYGGPYDVIGLSIPGHPGVYAGHNASIAWGASLSRLDDADIFLEELSESGQQYRHKERLLPLVQREEVIHVRGEAPRQRWVRKTLHGPLLSDALRGPMPPDLAYSLSWAGHEGVRETEGILQLNRATNWEQFRQALQFCRVPSLGFVYADRKGNIGGQIAGRSPQRPGQRRLFHPLPAADGAHDWQGDVPFEELPWAFNPPEGYLILSGQRPKAPLQGRELHGCWEPDYRSDRISSLIQRRIQNKQALTVEDLARLQRDHYSLWSTDFIERVLRPFEGKELLSPPVRSDLETILRWNGRAGPESVAASLFAMFQMKLAEQAYPSVLGEDLYRRWLEIAHELEPPVEALLRADEWLERGRSAAIHFALTQAHHTLQKRLGQQPDDWNWGRLHRLTLRPTFFWDSNLVKQHVRGPYNTGGDAFSINAGTHSWGRPFEHRVGSSARISLDLAQLDQSHWIMCGGQSERAGSVHYDDQLAHWLRGDALPMKYTPNALHATLEQWLAPNEETPSPDSYLPTIAPYPPYIPNKQSEANRAEEKE